MFEYKVHYLLDGDDMNWKKYSSKKELQKGDIIQLAGDVYHVVVDITEQTTQTRIDVSESADSEENAVLLAEQAGLITRN